MDNVQDILVNNKTVSIIIPVYNAEKYLKRCINSLFSQTYHDLEIILIEDGSIDRSKRICEEYERKYKNVVYFAHHENQGQVKTRNDGISLAKGRWIMFLDADDYLDKDVISNFVEIIRRDKSDIVCSGYKTIDAEGNEEFFYADIKDGKYSVKEFVSHFFDDIPMPVLSCIGAKIYDSDFVKKRKPATSNSIKTNYDMAFILDSLLAATSISYVSKPYYCYFQHKGSITTSYRKELYFRICEARRNMLPLLEKCGELEHKYYEYHKDQFGIIIWALMQEVTFNRGYKNYSIAFRSVISGTNALETVNVMAARDEKIEKRLLAFMIKRKKCFCSYILFNLKNRLK